MAAQLSGGRHGCFSPYYTKKRPEFQQKKSSQADGPKEAKAEQAKGKWEKEAERQEGNREGKEPKGKKETGKGKKKMEGKKIREEEKGRIRCIALDLDGTTLSDAKSLSPGNRQALEAAIACGIHVVVASGRALYSLPKVVTDLEGIEYAITSNGAAVYQLGSGQCIRRVTLAAEAVERTLELTENYCCNYEAFLEGIPYAREEYVRDPGRFGVMPYAIEYVRTTRRGVGDIGAFIREHAGELDGLDLVLFREEDKKEIWSLLQNSGEPLYITSSVRNRVELSSPQAGKAAGLRFLLEQLGISPEETVAFGDGDNDIDMLQTVGWGIAMANASPNCKKAADYITKTNLEDGVAYGIREILHIG